MWFRVSGATGHGRVKWNLQWPDMTIPLPARGNPVNPLVVARLFTFLSIDLSHLMAAPNCMT
jgi:hypothetical protein